jgi:hypothetical protein
VETAVPGRPRHPDPLKVFLVPVGPDRHVPYCEPRDGEPVPGGGEAGRGPWRGLTQRFREVLAAAERSRVRPPDGPEDRAGLLTRIKRRALRWVADRVAEQRLLWQLRGATQATLVYPSDLDAAQAERLLRQALQRDADRHRRWLIADGVILVFTGLFALLPGPNLLAYYFAFRCVGHFLSWRGARHGLGRVQWTAEACPPLVELRAAAGLEPGVRRARVREIATRLELPHLAAFFERIALRAS